jgi:cyclic-di-GMP phosphodiesterase TipF (flagellum assembly factor)
MVRISAIFIAVCLVLIAGCCAVVLYLRFGFTGGQSLLAGLALLTALAVYNAVAARLRDRAEVTEQLSALSRGSGDLARQIAEFGRKLSAVETRVEQVLRRSLASAQPMASELQELSTLVRQLADSVAAHEVALTGARVGAEGGSPQTPTVPAAPADPAATAQSPAMLAVPTPVLAAPAQPQIAGFAGLDRAGIIALVRNAIEAGKVDLYLQPIVTLPQRKVRYYEAMSRLKRENGDLVAAGDFLQYAEAGGLLPKLDQLTVLRCVQVVRRLLLKNRDIGLFCHVSSATLTDASFPQVLEFLEANRAIAGSLVFEFTQSAVRAMGPIEHENLATLAERGFRFSMGNLTDLSIEPRELNEHRFRFIKVPAALLLNQAGAASTELHRADFSDLLGRYGIDPIAERIESESTVMDLLDYDVRFGQGFLFAPPRPMRAEAPQAASADAAKDPLKPGAAEQRPAAFTPAAAAVGPSADLPGSPAQPVRADSAHT